MEQVQRIVLYAALLIVSLLLWNAWTKEHPSQPVKQATQPARETHFGPQTSTQPTNAVVAQAETVLNTNATREQAPEHRIIHVSTDVLKVGIDTLGGSIVSVELPKYPARINTPDVPYQLLTENPERFYIAESALLGKDGPDTSDTLAQYKSKQTAYVLQPSQNELQVVLSWQNSKGVAIDKIYTFQRNSYLVNVSYQISNHGSQEWSGQFYAQMSRKNTPPENGHLFQIHPYFGAAVSSPAKRYQEISFSDMDKHVLDQTIKSGWAAMVQRYFLSAWVPNPDESFNYYTKVSDNQIYTIGLESQQITVPPNTTRKVSARFYTGPAIASELKKIAPGLDLTVSYGWLWFISVIIFWVMEKIYLLVQNWGWSIILVTVLIKLMFYHLSAKSYKSMAKMRDLQPKIMALRERYADDKQKQSQAMMELYKKEKVNPLGGCLPIVVQIPVFFALYMVLIESVQLRQAPWILWIKDLSTPDPYFILPIIMGITMFVQQKLNPPPPDPTQAKVMMFLPVVFTVLFAYFPSGLVLYWAVNNLLSVLQQWYITRSYEVKSKKTKAK